MAEEKRWYLYQKINAASDGSGYSFFISPEFLNDGQKVKLVFVKRAKANKRIDLGYFYLDYRIFSSLLTILENKMRTGKLLKDDQGKDTKYVFDGSFYGGTDGKRRLHILASRGTVFFNCYDNLIQKEHEKYKDYTGKLMYSVKGALDLQEFFDIRNTLSNWELTHVQMLLSKGKDDTEKTEASK